MKTATKTFEAKLIARGPKGAWTYLMVPFDVAATFGVKGTCKVQGSINGHKFRTSLMPNGDSTHHLVVSKEMMACAKVAQGETAKITLAPDTEPRTVDIPPDLQFPPELKTFFDSLAFTHRREYVDWINQAKRPETRANRIAKALEMLADKKKLAR
jgi:hypothetical protein